MAEADFELLGSEKIIISMNWENIVREWISSKRSYRPFESDFLKLFEIAFGNTLLPEKSWFGFPPHKSSLGLFFGRVMLVGIFQRTVEIIVDRDISKEIGIPTRIVGSSKSDGRHLYWITTDFSNIKKLTSNELVWEHYKRASQKVDSYSNIRFEREDWKKGKYPLSLIYDHKLPSGLSYDEYKVAFEKEVLNSSQDVHENRIARLKEAAQMPRSAVSKTRVFLRNADVVAEVLFRAKGHCEHCRKSGPFKRDIDHSVFLEVHHVKPLSEGGPDTVDNCLALCPNCHRHVHHGKKTFYKNDISKDPIRPA